MNNRDVFFSFQSPASAGKDLRVVRMTGQEQLGRPSEFILDLAGQAVKIEDMIGATATLRMRFGTSELCHTGILAWLIDGGETKGVHRYRALLTPRLALLKHRATNGVYVDKNLPDILTDVLQGIQLQQRQDFAMQFVGKYEPRELTCRYQETELNFLHRLIERHGVYYYFTADDSDTDNDSANTQEDQLIFADAPTCHHEPDEKHSFRFIEPSGLARSESANLIYDFNLEMCQRIHSVAIEDYNPDRPDLAIAASQQGGSTPGGERFFGGMATNPSEAGNLAKIRVQALDCHATMYTGFLDTPGVRAGQCIKLQNHPYGPFNASYLVTSVCHEGTQAFGSGYGAGKGGPYKARFTAIPADMPFRLLWNTPKPRISGVLSATVTAATSGEYAEVDEQGRYQVVLPFGHRADEPPPSPRIRMLQPYGGGAHGLHFPLHKGTEVQLIFLQGDPDRPIICGATPNHDQASMVTGTHNTAHAMQTSSGNVLLADDNTSNSQIHLSSPNMASYFVLGKLSQDQKDSLHQSMTFPTGVSGKNAGTDNTGGSGNGQ